MAAPGIETLVETAQKRAPNEVPTAVFDVAEVRAQFPALGLEIHGHSLVYLDNAATTQKPRSVIEAVETVYLEKCANIHRSVHTLAERATTAYEGARERIGRFIGAGAASEIVFTRGATEAINLVAWSFVRPRLSPGDRVLITHLEHHANIVPWQIVCEQTGARLDVVPIDDRGQVSIEAFEALLTPRTRIFATAQISNALGTINPVEEMIAKASQAGVPVLIDGAQQVPHGVVDVRALGCDFFVFSGHKVYGPSGTGVLWGKPEHLAAMTPYQGGGDMIRSVRFEKTEYAEPPHRFEAGTPNIEGTVGLAAAVDFLAGLDRAAVAEHEASLLAHATEALQEISGLTVIGTADAKAAVLSFSLDGVHPHDLATLLDRQGVAIRAGHHCAQPVMQHFGIPATARASFGIYNTHEEVEILASAVRNARELFSA